MENSTLALNHQTTQSFSPSIAYSPSFTAPPPVKLALFGVGRWGSHFLRKCLEHPQAELVAVTDPCSDRLNTLARQYQLDQRQITLTSDWQTALQLPGVEAVIIVTPATTHYSLIQAALEQGHHVLAEKPLTLTTSESLALCQLAEQQQKQLVVDHTYLFHAAVQQGRAVIQQGKLGELRYGYAARTHLGPIRQDVDALWDLAVHDIAIFNNWLNDTPVQVQAHGTNWLQSGSTTNVLPDQFCQGLSDLVWVKLTYANGFQAVIHLCWSNPDKQRRLTVVGSQGALVFDEMAETQLMLLQGSLEAQSGQFAPVGQCHTPIEFEPIEPLQSVCSHFLDCVQQNRASEISSGWLGAGLVQILSALTQSLQQGGKPVQVERF